MPQTLLLADDSVTIQRVIELTFADEAITVVAVSDGDQAIERIDADPPDIVLVDIGMPGRTGYEVAQHIKQSERLKHIPVLLLTGAFEPVDQSKAVEAGCDGVLAKPFEPQLVIARVKELLGRGQDAAPAAERSAPSLSLGSPALPGENWAASPAESTGERSRPAQVVRLDDYFERLDAAFQRLGDSAPPEQPKEPVAASPDIIDWFGATAAAHERLTDLPLSSPAPAPQTGPDGRLAEWAGPEPVAAPPEPRLMPESASPEPAVPLPEPLSPVGTLPPLADAFAAILAAEQREPMPAVAPAWPTPHASSNGGGSLSEGAIEEITRRVLDRLSDQVVRNTVADVISGIAERLVREEIERIKSSIK
jgi:CheY-like chemotaxis protein